MAKLIVKGGNIAWDGKPGRGGHILFVLQWLKGLERLGHEVLYYDSANDHPACAELFARIVERWWSPVLSALVSSSGQASYGLGAREVEVFARESAAIISLGCTFTREPEPWLAGVRPRALIEQDPGFSHFWASQASAAEVFGVHDYYYTVGANVGSPRCSIPTFGIAWRPIWNPVVIDWWDPGHPITHDRFTTIGGWWAEGYQVFDGKVWGPKAEQMRRFVQLPQLVAEEFEISLETSADDPEVRHLQSFGWRVVSPSVTAADAHKYREYVNGSKGEFSCAKGLYVGTRPGWFSDRSSCYLAAGRPVVVQDTGFGDVLPTGDGLFSVNSTANAVECIREIQQNYAHHCAAAREIAVSYFDSQRVLKRLLADLGVG